MIVIADNKMGCLRNVERAEREQSGTLSLSERYVADCLRVNDDYSAGILIRRGDATGWRMWLTSDGLVELWGPPTDGQPATSYTMRNEVLRRALLARGVKAVPTLRHRVMTLALSRLGMQGV